MSVALAKMLINLAHGLINVYPHQINSPVIDIVLLLIFVPFSIEENHKDSELAWDALCRRHLTSQDSGK